ncbi:MAG TPA: DUF2225 domain-containing protein [Clostridia bacterium]
MGDNINNGLFKNLNGLGFENLDNISIYESREEKNDSRQKEFKNLQQNLEQYVFERKVECPVCYKHITVPAVKSSAIRVVSKDTDFMTYYQDPNPTFYDVWFCKLCGYAAVSNKFSIISDTQKKLIRENISSKWKFNKKYPVVFDADTAIETHQLALLNSVVKLGRDNEKALLCLRLGWLYRLKGDEENEKRYLANALMGFTNSFLKDSITVPGLDEAATQYLIGELYRRTGDNSNALQWFGRVLSDRNAKEKIKSMTRDQKDIILALNK